jgi:transposase-like protein
VNVTINGETKRTHLRKHDAREESAGKRRAADEFYISVKAQQETKYSAMSQNEWAAPCCKAAS